MTETETAAQSLLSLASPMLPSQTPASAQSRLPPPASIHQITARLPSISTLPHPTLPKFPSTTSSSSSTIASIPHSHDVPQPCLAPLTPQPTRNLHTYNTPSQDTQTRAFQAFKLPPLEAVTPPYSPQSYTSAETERAPVSAPTNPSQVMSAAFTLGPEAPPVRRRLDMSDAGVRRGGIEKRVPIKNKKASHTSSCCTTPSSSSVTESHDKKPENLPSVTKTYRKVYANATPSSYCHVCSRTRKSVQFAECALIKQGLCRKVICDKCFAAFGWDWEFAKTGEWICVHCRDQCPSRAQCHIYKRINSRRGGKKKTKSKNRNLRGLAQKAANMRAKHEKMNAAKRASQVQQAQQVQQQSHYRQYPSQHQRSTSKHKPRTQHYHHQACSRPTAAVSPPRAQYADYSAPHPVVHVESRIPATPAVSAQPQAPLYSNQGPSMIPPISTLLSPHHMVH